MLPSTAITRTELSATFSEFDLAMSRLGFIGPRVFRPVPVGIQAADAGKLPLAELLSGNNDDRRAAGGGYKSDDFEFDKYSYATEEHGREAPLDDRQLKIFRSIIDAEDITSQRVIDKVLRGFEVNCAAAAYDAVTNWVDAQTPDIHYAITHEWDDPTNGVPITDIEAARRLVLAASGLLPNALICNRDQFWNLRQTAQVIDRLKYAGFDDPKRFTLAAMGEMMDLEYIIVAGLYDPNQKNTANQGQSASLSSIWGDEHAMVARVATTDDPQEPCIGRTFMWNEDSAGPGTDEEIAVITEEYRQEGVRGSVIRARTDYDIKIMYPQAGCLLSNVTTI